MLILLHALIIQISFYLGGGNLQKNGNKLQHAVEIARFWATNVLGVVVGGSSGTTSQTPTLACLPLTRFSGTRGKWLIFGTVGGTNGFAQVRERPPSNHWSIECSRKSDAATLATDPGRKRLLVQDRINQPRGFALGKSTPARRHLIEHSTA